MDCTANDELQAMATSVVTNLVYVRGWLYRRRYQANLAGTAALLHPTRPPQEGIRELGILITL
eukprot:COSAG06_NODE_48951_length_328_cov_1.379913_1_plen_63_part_10